MLTGTLWLDFEDEEDESHYQAQVERAIIREHEIILQFKGGDLDDGPFSGQCQLSKQEAFFIGVGYFLCGGKRYDAVVRASLKQAGGNIELSGTWQDAGDPDPYDFSVDLEETAGSGS